MNCKSLIASNLDGYSKDRRHIVLLSENDDQETYAPIRLDPERDSFQIEGVLSCMIRRDATRRPP